MCPLSLLPQKPHTWLEMGEKQTGVRNSSNASKMIFSTQTSINKSNFLNSTSSSKTLSNSSKTLNLVEIRRLVK